MKPRLWNKNFTLLITATVLGAAGGIAGSFALSFLVFDETQSTLSAALTVAVAVIPAFVIPLFAAPIMDRLPRKPFLVGGDFLNSVLYVLAGIYLLNFSFSYIGYLGFSVLLSSVSAFDELAYNSIYPKLLAKGAEEKGYAVSGMLYPVVRVLMTPVAAVLLDTIGVGRILIIQGGLSFAAAITESFISVEESSRLDGGGYSLKTWCSDIREAAEYLKNEKGLRTIYAYMAVTNGTASGYSSLLIAFFRTAAGFTAAMYSFFSTVEFTGRSIGGVFCYKVHIPKKRRFSFAFFVYMVYESMDACLLWLPYPLMLINRGICGFLGINSATMRHAAVQSYIPESLRSRLNAFESMLYFLSSAMLSLAVGALGEILDYRVCLSFCAFSVLIFCLMTVWKNRSDVKKLYESVD